MRKLTARQVRDMQDQKKEFLLINVLPEEHFQREHIPGSVNVPVDEDRFLKRVEHLVKDRGTEVVVYCSDHSCKASSRAAEQLEEADFRNVSELAGGMREWEEAGLPVEGQAVGA